MADRYPNFAPGMMPQQHHPIQQQQQQPQDNHHPMVGFNDQNWMQQQMRPQNQMDIFRARQQQQQQQQQQQFMQQPFMDNQNQPHMPMGFNMGIQQSMHNRNNMLQTLQNSRQLELIGMAQNQQNQNGPIRPSTDLFSSPAINGDAMRRPSPAHPNQPPPQPSTQPMRQVSRPEIQERVQQMRSLITQVDNAMHQLQNSRAGMNDAVFVAKMRQLQTERNNRAETLQRMLTVFNNMNMPLPNGQYMQTPFGASQPNNPPQPPSLPVHNAPPRTGPTPQQPNTPFHGQMGNPNFGLNPMNPQNPASGSGPGTMPNSAPPALPVFSVSPLEKGRFDQSFKVWCQQKSVLIDPRLLNIDGRPIDLYSLHSHVIREGGLGNVQAKDLWAVIGARMGFVQFPGTSNEPPKSGPVIAQNLAHVYKEYLAAFDAVYIASLENKRKQLGVNARPNATPPGGSLAGFPPKNWTPHQLRVILSSADKSREALAAQGFPENAITFIETHRAQLQQMVTDQSAFRDIIRPNQNSSIDGNRPMPFPLPTTTTSQPQPSNPNQGQFPMQPNGQPPSGPPRFSRELISNAHMNITRMKAEITQRISAAPNVDVPAEQRVEYNDLLERANRQATEFETKLHVFYAMTRNEETVKKLVHNIVLVQQQRTMLSWSNPRLILGMDMLRQSLAHITHAAEQLSFALSNIMKAQPQGANNNNNNNNNAATNNSGPRPPLQIPPPPQQHSSPPPTLAPSLSRPLNIQQPPKKKPPTAGPSPTVAPAPTPPPAAAATTPVASAATPTNSNAAASPQTPKSPKTKVKPKPPSKTRRPSVKGNQAATPSSSTPAEPPAPAPVAGVKRPHEGDVSSPNNNAPTPAGPSLVASEPSPPKRVKTEWDGEVSESLKKKNEAVENIRTDEDANQFFEQTLSELMKMSGDDGQASLTSDISDTLDMILKNYGGVPESGGASGDLDGSTSAPPGSSDDFGQYFDFSSFTHDDDEESKTPDLISSSSANPSPESDTDSVHPHHGPIADIKQEDFDPLRLGTLKEIDGGESAYYQSSEWKWDGAMPNNEQPWAIFNS